MAPIAGAQLAGQQVVHSLLDFTAPQMADSAMLMISTAPSRSCSAPC